MDLIDAQIIARTILAAPHLTRAGLAADSGRQREDSANQLARAIVEQICPGRPEQDPNQLGLAL